MSAVIQEQFALLSIGLIVIGTRCVLRWRQVGPSGFQLDDYLMPLTGLVFSAETVAAYLVGARFQGLTNSYMTAEQRETLDPDSREYYNRQWGSGIQVIGWSFYAFILWALKFCVTAFYGRLTSGLVHLKLRVTIAYILLGVTYATVALTILLSCQPMSHFWQIYPDPGRLCQPTNSPAYVLVVVIPNILTDIYLLSIPLPLVWGVNISLRRRITLVVLFSGALFIMMAGTIRAIVISTSGPNGAVAGSSWACRETFVAIIVTNLPILQPLLRKIASATGLSILFSRSSPTHSNSYQLRSGEAGTRLDGSRKKGTQHRHPLSIPQASAWGSDEHILPEESGSESGMKRSESRKNQGIVVAHEISVRSEEAGAPGSAPHGNNWELNAAASGNSTPRPK
ncbi:hypothetical protein B0I35DRAFT_260095 [Stachybotrys elegans]|uniref:Rhodopsin domain-containing protein n=1 Tax=Stachybotrys elegans TaxID=80388 RepID=A0A8K0SM85_9HYPO|nr:hypothetical protein B0I35DRAFT_260095 [Stachybotrys elegans]